MITEEDLAGLLNYHKHELMKYVAAEIEALHKRIDDLEILQRNQKIQIMKNRGY